MDLRESADDRTFRAEVRSFLEDGLGGEFAAVRGRGGPGDEGAMFAERQAWERHLGAHGWTCVGWPKEHGGRGLSLRQQVVYHEEYARARAPGRLGIIGEGLLGPTVIAFGSPEQQRRFLPPIVAGEELWCQGYSEPGAGSDLAGIATRAERDGDEWVITGQKVWTSLAHWAQWCFVLARTAPVADPGRRHQGISYLLVPMDQPGIEVRPIVQLTGTSEFNEVFFDDARTDADLVVGEVGQGWSVAMGTLTFERGISTLGQQVGFARELSEIVELAERNGAASDPVIKDKLTRAWMGLQVMRAHAMRTLSAVDASAQGGEASVAKLLWANWHRGLGELAMEVAGADSLLAGNGPFGADADLSDQQRLFLFSRADTIYGGSNEIQRNIIAERVLGLPREARP